MKSHAQFHGDESILQDGDEVIEVDGWCDLCDWAFGGSMTTRRAIYLQGKFYHHTCYPIAVRTYLATKKLKGGEQQWKKH